MERDGHLNSKIKAQETEALASRVSDFSLREESLKTNRFPELVIFNFFFVFCFIFLLVNWVFSFLIHLSVIAFGYVGIWSNYYFLSAKI